MTHFARCESRVHPFTLGQLRPIQKCGHHFLLGAWIADHHVPGLVHVTATQDIDNEVESLNSE